MNLLAVKHPLAAPYGSVVSTAFQVPLRLLSPIFLRYRTVFVKIDGSLSGTGTAEGDQLFDDGGTFVSYSGFPQSFSVSYSFTATSISTVLTTAALARHVARSYCSTPGNIDLSYLATVTDPGSYAVADANGQAVVVSSPDTASVYTVGPYLFSRSLSYNTVNKVPMQYSPAGAPFVVRDSGWPAAGYAEVGDFSVNGEATGAKVYAITNLNLPLDEYVAGGQTKATAERTLPVTGSLDIDVTGVD